MNYKSLLAFVFVQVFYTSVALSAADLSQYGYEQNVQFSPVSKTTSVSVTLPNEALQAINEKFSNLHLINARNEEIPFEVYYGDQAWVNTIDQVQVSSVKADNDPASLLDNNRLTEFTFDERVDGSGASTVLVDFGRILDLHRIKIWTSGRARIRGMQVRVGANKNRLKTVKAESAFTDTIDGTFPLARFVELSFWGQSVKIQDILFFERETAEVYFEATPGMSYRLLFGNPEVSFFQFKNRLSTRKEVAINAKLSKQKFNRLLSEDVDGDTILNEADNCPFVDNKNQKDTDDDGAGDVCDNAVKQKNYDQSDVDRDGVGDIIDNCKMVKNPGQYDNDKDTIGDACDTAENDIKAVKAVSTNSSTDSDAPLLWLTSFFLVVLIGVGGWYFLKKKKH